MTSWPRPLIVVFIFFDHYALELNAYWLSSLTFVSVPGVVGEGALSSPHVQVCFNYHQSAQDNNMLVMEQLEPAVLWYNEDLDVAVLELQIPRDFHSFPDSLGDLLGDVNQSLKFHLIGHSGGGYKALNLCCEIRPPSHPDVESLEWHPSYTLERFPTLLDPSRTLLEASMIYGASGSPCFDDLGSLVLMHASGLFIDGVHVFDQGVNLIDVYRLMLREKRELAVQLFGLRSELEQGNSTQCGLLFYESFYFIFSNCQKCAT